MTVSGIEKFVLPYFFTHTIKTKKCYDPLKTYTRQLIPF
jgi:hypothetical protein